MKRNALHRTLCGMMFWIAVICSTMLSDSVSFGYSLDQAANNEIRGMTGYSIGYLLDVPKQGKMSYKNAVKYYAKKWAKGWKNKKTMLAKADNYELLARTLFHESSPNSKPKLTRENEILAFNKVIKYRCTHPYTEGLFGGPTLFGVLIKPQQFNGLTLKKDSHKTIKIGKKVDLSWVRSVVVSVAEKFHMKDLREPDKEKYYYWHSSGDWNKFTNKNHSRVRFVGENTWYKVTIVKHYSDTFFYDYDTGVR